MPVTKLRPTSTMKTFHRHYILPATSFVNTTNRNSYLNISFIKLVTH